MTKETLKELGKLGLDLAKIIFAIAILPAILSDKDISLYSFSVALIFAIGGTILINKGTKEND